MAILAKIMQPQPKNSWPEKLPEATGIKSRRCISAKIARELSGHLNSFKQARFQAPSIEYALCPIIYRKERKNLVCAPLNPPVYNLPEVQS